MFLIGNTSTGLFSGPFQVRSHPNIPNTISSLIPQNNDLKKTPCFPQTYRTSFCLVERNEMCGADNICFEQTNENPKEIFGLKIAIKMSSWDIFLPCDPK